MIFVYAFLICGIICAIAELIINVFKLTPGHLTTSFVIVGVGLDSFGIYDKLIDIAGAGAMLPICSFGHSLAHASYSRALEDGYIGIFTGVFDTTAGGIALVIFLAVLIGFLFKPKS